METTPTFGNWVGLDRLGTVASSVCALHCALCAIAPSLLTVLGLGALVSHSAEWGFTIIASALAVAAAIKGGCACGSWKAPTLLFAGVIILVMSRFMEEAGLESSGVFVSLLGGSILVAGHLANLRACRKTRLMRRANN
jgi:hypothetical protein